MFITSFSYINMIKITKTYNFLLLFWSGYGSRTQCLQDMNLTFKPFHSPAILWRWGESNPRLDSNAIKSFTSLVSFFCNQQSQRFLIHSFYIVIKVCYFSDGSSDFVTTLSPIRNQGVMEAYLSVSYVVVCIIAD